MFVLLVTSITVGSPPSSSITGRPLIHVGVGVGGGGDILKGHYVTVCFITMSQKKKKKNRRCLIHPRATRMEKRLRNIKEKVEILPLWSVTVIAAFVCRSLPAVA